MLSVVVFEKELFPMKILYPFLFRRIKLPFSKIAGQLKFLSAKMFLSFKILVTFSTFLRF